MKISCIQHNYDVKKIINDYNKKRKKKKIIKNKTDIYNFITKLSKTNKNKILKQIKFTFELKDISNILINIINIYMPFANIKNNFNNIINKDNSYVIPDNIRTNEYLKTKYEKCIKNSIESIDFLYKSLIKIHLTNILDNNKKLLDIIVCYIDNLSKNIYRGYYKYDKIIKAYLNKENIPMLNDLIAGCKVKALQDIEYIYPNAMCRTHIITVNAFDLYNFYNSTSNKKDYINNQFEYKTLKNKMLTVLKSIAPEIFNKGEMINE